MSCEVASCQSHTCLHIPFTFLCLKNILLRKALITYWINELGHSSIDCMLNPTDCDALLLFFPCYLLQCGTLYWLIGVSYINHATIYGIMKHPTRFQTVIIGLSWHLGGWADPSRFAAPACWSMCLWLCASSEKNNVGGQPLLSDWNNIGTSCMDLPLNIWQSHLFSRTDVKHVIAELDPVIRHKSIQMLCEQIYKST